MWTIPSFVILKTSTPWPDAVSRSDDALIAPIASSVASSIDRSGLYVRSSIPRM